MSVAIFAVGGRTIARNRAMYLEVVACRSNVTHIANATSVTGDAGTVDPLRKEEASTKQDTTPVLRRQPMNAISRLGSVLGPVVEDLLRE